MFLSLTRVINLIMSIFLLSATAEDGKSNRIQQYTGRSVSPVLLASKWRRYTICRFNWKMTLLMRPAIYHTQWNTTNLMADSTQVPRMRDWQRRNGKFISVSGGGDSGSSPSLPCLSFHSFSLASFLFPSLSPPWISWSGPSNPAKGLKGALSAPFSRGKRHLQLPDTFTGNL